MLRSLVGSEMCIRDSSGTAKTSTLRCAGKPEEIISLSVGTTTTPGECKLDTTKGLEKRNWQFHEPEKEEEIEYIMLPVHPLLGNLSLKDLLIIGLATASILLSLGLGLAYIHLKRTEGRNQRFTYPEIHDQKQTQRVPNHRAVTWRTEAGNGTQSEPSQPIRQRTISR